MDEQSSQGGQVTSLLRHCEPCGSKCCKYSSPILDEAERDRIVSATQRDLFLPIETDQGVYYIIGINNDGSRRKIAPDESGAGQPCGFLDDAGRCSIHLLKPMDCAAYPLRAVPDEGAKLSWHLHRSCPAAPDLSIVFLRHAATLAEASAKRFKHGVFAHWLEHFSRWTLAQDSRIELPEIIGSREGARDSLGTDVLVAGAQDGS